MKLLYCISCLEFVLENLHDQKRINSILNEIYMKLLYCIWDLKFELKWIQFISSLKPLLGHLRAISAQGLSQETIYDLSPYVFVITQLFYSL